MLHLQNTKKGDANETTLVKILFIRGILPRSMFWFATNIKTNKTINICYQPTSNVASEIQIYRRFQKNISLSFHVYESFKTTPTPNDVTTADERGIYLLQTISIDNKPYTIFFDTGCSDFIVKRSAI